MFKPSSFSEMALMLFKQKLIARKIANKLLVRGEPLPEIKIVSTRMCGMWLGCWRCEGFSCVSAKFYTQLEGTSAGKTNPRSSTKVRPGDRRGRAGRGVLFPGLRLVSVNLVSSVGSGGAAPTRVKDKSQRKCASLARGATKIGNENKRRLRLPGWDGDAEESSSWPSSETHQSVMRKS